MRKRIDADELMPSLNINEIEQTGCFYYEDDPTVLYVKARPKRHFSGPCPCCGAYGVKGHGKKTFRYIHDISIGETSIDIVLTTPRYICPHQGCGKSFTHKFDFVRPRSKFTKRLERNIVRQALSYRFADVAREYGVTIPTISKMVEDYADEYDRQRHLIAPRVLGIDENKLGKTLCGVLTDIEKGVLLDITPSRKNDVLEKAITQMDGFENIEIVTIDMCDAYRRLVHQNLPDAVIVVDRFHVMKQIIGGIDSARKVLVNYLNSVVEKIEDPEEKKKKEELLNTLGNFTFLFRYNDEKLAKKIKENEKMSKLLGCLTRTFPEFAKLYKVRRECDAIYRSKTREEAEEKIKHLKRYMLIYKGSVDVTAEDKEHEEVRKAAKKADKEAYKELLSFINRTYKNWKNEILNYFDHPYTNAATEGLNSLIVDFYRSGKSYKFKVYRMKALYASQAAIKKPVSARRKPDKVSNCSVNYGVRPIAKDKINEYKTMKYIGSSINKLVEEFDKIF